MNTKEKILDESLRLFSEKGFDAVSVREIARCVGIKESSLYNHFTGKEDIFESILSEYSERENAFYSGMELEGQFSVDQKTLDMYRNMPPEQFRQFALKIFDFYFTDELNVRMRRMLTMEQYRSAGVRDMFREISFEAGLAYQASLFGAFMKAGLFKKADPDILALEFLSPVFLIFYKFDNDAEGLPRARELFLRHIDHFNRTYTMGMEGEEK